MASRPVMDAKVLAWVLLKLAGVMMIVDGALSLGFNLVYWATLEIFYQSTLATVTRMNESSLLASGASSMARFAIGVYLVFGGRAVIKLLARQISGLCVLCGYDLRASSGPRCPECGALFEMADPADVSPAPTSGRSEGDADQSKTQNR